MSALNGGDRSVSRHGRFTSEETGTSTYGIVAGWTTNWSRRFAGRSLGPAGNRSATRRSPSPEPAAGTIINSIPSKTRYKLSN